MLSFLLLTLVSSALAASRPHDELARKISKRALEFNVSTEAALHDIESRLGKRQNPPVQVVSSCSVPGIAALTFDDGMYIYNSALQDVFDAHSARTSFFVNSNNYQCLFSSYEDMKRAFYNGHLLASHTNSHKDLTTLNWDQLHDEFWTTELIFLKMFGAVPRFYRPPFGSTNGLVRAVAQNRGYSHEMLWDYDSGDSSANPPTAQQQIAGYNTQANKPRTAPGSLMLGHETSQATLTAMQSVVPSFKQKGWQLEAVPLCLGLHSSKWDWPSWYRWIQPPSERDATWTCSP